MHLDASQAPTVAAARAEHGFFARLYWTQVFTHADGAKVMFLSALAGSVLAAVLALTRREEAGPRRPLGLVKVCKTYASGITGFSYALVILILAWAIKETCEAVETSAYIVGALSGFLDPHFLPILVFLLAAVVAFSIGTSWTTMAVLLPTMIPVAYDLGGLELTVLVAAAVLDGAIFGDHCSPDQRYHRPLQHCRRLRPLSPRSHPDTLRPDYDDNRRAVRLLGQHSAVVSDHWLGRGAMLDCRSDFCSGKENRRRLTLPWTDYHPAVVRSTNSSNTMFSARSTAGSRSSSSANAAS